MKHNLIAASIAATLSTGAFAATYQLEELPTMAGTKQSYITAIAPNGNYVGQARGIYNLPIDISYIDFKNGTLISEYDNEVYKFKLINKTITFTLDDIKAGNLNADAHNFMLRFLAKRSGDATWQKISDLMAIKYANNEVTEQLLFDEQAIDYDGVTRSVSNFYTAIAQDGTSVGWGSAPFEKMSFTPEGQSSEKTYFVRDFTSKGLVFTPSGDKITLPVLFDEHGGVAIATDIVAKPDGGYYVVGDSSVGIPSNRQENYTSQCTGKSEPVAVCAWRLQRGTGFSAFYDRRAVRWTLDTSFNVTATDNLGLGFEKTEDEQKNAVRSTALAINSQGVAVGYSNVRYKNSTDKVFPTIMPVIFKDGNVINFIDQDDGWYEGKAINISENNIVTGYVTKTIDGGRRTQFFYHDLATGKTTFPTGYFKSSSSISRGINANNVIVGEAEIDSTNTSNRRREAFMYTLGEEKITNINKLLPCYDESSFPYTMAEAIAINDNNEIFGVATKTAEKTNSYGEVVKDADGKTEYETIPVPVKLTPINGEVESCAPPAAKTYERQSGNLAWFSLLLLPLVVWRRKTKVWRGK